MKKILFVDRDGTLIIEPEITKQVNSLDEMTFLPMVISSLKRFMDAGFEIIIVTNQDGLDTDANPRNIYDNINKKMIETFAGERVIFSELFECPHFPDDNCNCRKPATGMVDQYLKSNKVDLENSYMIGDRKTDIDFADNIGVTGYLLSNDLNWQDIAKTILDKPRIATINRKTKETSIDCKLNLDGTGIYNIDTGLKFFDHMLEQLSKHSNIDIDLNCKGDLEIDEHHTIEDVAITIGDTLKQALGDKRGITRYAWDRILVMDEAKIEISIDLSARPFVVFEADFKREYVGDLPTEMVEHFFQSLCIAAGINLHAKIEGSNTHHMVEASFKALARSLKDAVRVDGNQISSTKGAL